VSRGKPSDVDDETSSVGRHDAVLSLDIAHGVFLVTGGGGGFPPFFHSSNGMGTTLAGH
jgi:hypothetical protein